MTLLRLSLLVVVLGLAIGLALTNPVMDDYLRFVEVELGKALDRSGEAKGDRDMSMVRSIYRSHSHELVRSFVRPRTTHRNWGLVSIYESKLFETEIIVLGISGRFIPLKGIDEAILRLGRMAF